MDLSLYNENQVKAITSTDQYILVLAGAGSGKTRTITGRIVHLIELGVKARTILAITFTNKAANEMKSRIGSALEKHLELPSISTIHSSALKILREDSILVGLKSNFTILDEEDQKKVINDLLRKYNDEEKKQLDKNKLFVYINHVKNDDLDLNELKDIIEKKESENELELLRNKFLLDYERYNIRHNQVDFNDILIKTCNLLQNNENVRNKWRERYHYILVDEYQDISPIQYEYIKLLSGDHTSLFVVGDPDQTIYSFRGANINIINSFTKNYKDAKQITLDFNYRSTKEIINVANELIANNFNRIEKKLVPTGDVGDKVTYFEGFNAQEEATNVINKIKYYVKSNLSKYRDHTILIRSAFLSRSIESELIKKRIPYRVYAGIKFYERAEIKDAIAYLRVFINHNDQLAFERAIKTPRRDLGEVTLNRFKELSLEKGMSLFDIVKSNIETLRKNAKSQVEYFFEVLKRVEEMSVEENLSIKDTVFRLLERTGYLETLKNNDESERLENLYELFNSIEYWEKENKDLTIEEYIQEASLLGQQDEINDQDAVTIMTIHTAKGLEFPYVYVMGLSENTFPSYKALEAREEEEERRLAYVAFTRAEKRLFLSSNKEYNWISNVQNKMSRFINEIKELLEFENVEKKSISRSYSRVIFNTKEEEVVTNVNNPFKISDTVFHKTFGEGIVINISGEIVIVSFKDPNYQIKKIKYTFLTKI